MLNLPLDEREREFLLAIPQTIKQRHHHFYITGVGKVIGITNVQAYVVAEALEAKGLLANKTEDKRYTLSARGEEVLQELERARAGHPMPPPTPSTDAQGKPKGKERDFLLEGYKKLTTDPHDVWKTHAIALAADITEAECEQILKSLYSKGILTPNRITGGPQLTKYGWEVCRNLKVSKKRWTTRVLVLSTMGTAVGGFLFSQLVGPITKDYVSDWMKEKSKTPTSQPATTPSVQPTPNELNVLPTLPSSPPTG